MKYLTYFLFRILVFALAYLPYSFIYKISDFLAFVLNKVVKYRSKIILVNLQNSFPHKSKKEIELIKDSFYKHFADIVLESFKAYGMEKDEFLDRFHITNPELANKYFEENKSVIVLGSHFSNWEWGVICVNLQVKHPLNALYKPLSQPLINNFIKNSRTQYGLNLYPIRNTSEAFEKLETSKKIYAMIMMADQSPSNASKSYWTHFLNQKTACLHGPEKHARKTGNSILYFHPKRIKRGYYECELLELGEYNLKKEEGLLTDKYMSTLESRINENPEQWLWSHRRWKKELPTNPFWVNQ